MEVQIRPASMRDAEIIAKHDIWVSPKTIADKIEQGQVYVACVGEEFVGWLRYNLFWDNTPFMTMLHLLPDRRGRGIGTKLVLFWEERMKAKGYKILLTSSAQTESAQHFYNRLGYKAIGGFNLLREPYEIIFCKEL